jgi:hypothetical protein
VSHRIARGAAAVTVTALVLLLTAGPALAHEPRQVGAIHVFVGWQNEPTYAGQPNAVQIMITDKAGKPVDDLGSPPSLQVTASTGSQTSPPLELKPSFDPDSGLGTHGEFDAAIMPTAVGTYTFHFTGSIAGQKVDEKFTSSDKTFNDVVDVNAIEFPTKVPGLADVATNVQKLGPRVDNAVTAAATAHDSASTATTVAIVALVIGGLLGVAGIGVGLSAKR